MYVRLHAIPCYNDIIVIALVTSQELVDQSFGPKVNTESVSNHERFSSDVTFPIVFCFPYTLLLRLFSGFLADGGRLALDETVVEQAPEPVVVDAFFTVTLLVTCIQKQNQLVIHKNNNSAICKILYNEHEW